MELGNNPFVGQKELLLADRIQEFALQKLQTPLLGKSR